MRNRLVWVFMIVGIALGGCGEPAPERVVVNAPPPPDWVPAALQACLTEADVAATRARLFATGTDREVFAGLAAFADAKPVWLRRVAAFHLASMAPVAELHGIPAEAVLHNLSIDQDEEVRRLAARVGNSDLEAVEVTPIESGEATVGAECVIPYPGLDGAAIHLRVRKITPGGDSGVATLDYTAEVRPMGGALMGSSGSRFGPNLTRLSYLGMLTEEGQMGFELWLRVLEEGRVRWWMRGLSRPVAGEKGG